ncbi:hypothetical protein IAT38_002407 [Cryptococcus sp. DSM 104549]
MPPLMLPPPPPYQPRASRPPPYTPRRPLIELVPSSLPWPPQPPSPTSTPPQTPTSSSDSIPLSELSSSNCLPDLADLRALHQLPLSQLTASGSRDPSLPPVHPDHHTQRMLTRALQDYQRSADPAQWGLYRHGRPLAPAELEEQGGVFDWLRWAVAMMAPPVEEVVGPHGQGVGQTGAMGVTMGVPFGM